MVKSSLIRHNADEFSAPIALGVDTVEMGIAAELIGVTDMELLELMLPGVGETIGV